MSSNMLRKAERENQNISQEETPKNDLEEMLEKFKANTVLFEDEKRNKKRR